MVNSIALKKAIDISGIKQKVLANKIGITQNSLSRKLNNKSEFKLSEVEKLCVILDIESEAKDCIFFAQNVE